MPSLFHRSSLYVRKSLRRYIARPTLQQAYRFMYRVALAGMNYGGAGSVFSAGDEIPLRLVRRLRERTPTRPVVFDVGANIGSYVSQILRIVGDDTAIYAFEPSSAAFDMLKKGFENRSNIELVHAGVGAKDGTATLWSAVPGSVLASMYMQPTDEALAGEPMRVIALDRFCEERGIEHITLLKVDVEGGELAALQGAATLLSRGQIAMIQFEFGQPSIGSRTFFVDLFELLRKQYDLYRLLPSGLARIEGYHETLEVFMSTNYLAVSRSMAASLLH